MLFKKSQKVKPSPPPPSDASRQEAAFHLRMADKHIRDAKFAEAGEELNIVRSIDANNVYALALGERLQALMAEAERKAHAPPEEVLESQQEGIEEGTQTAEHGDKVEIDEQAIRSEIQRRLEEEYKSRIDEETRKVNERIAVALKQEREAQQAERASLVADLEREKENFRQQLGKEAKEKYDADVAKMEASFREQVTKERSRAEEAIKAEMNALYEKSKLELKETANREKRGLLDKEQRAIEENKKQMQKEFETHLATEIARVESTTKAQREKERKDLIDSTRLRLENEFQQKLESDKKRIESQIKSQQEELEKKYQERHDDLEAQTREEIEKRINEVRTKGQEEFEGKYQEAKRQLESEYKSKLAAEIASEREKMEKQMEERLRVQQSKLEENVKKITGGERPKANGVTSDVDMEKELEKRVTQAKGEMEAEYAKKIRVDLEKKLEAEYNKKFTDEIRKAEQRIAEALKKEREWQEAERASLISNLEKEKEKFRRELEKESKVKADVEVANMEATYRQQLSTERKRAEEETRSEMSALYERSMLDLKETAVREKRALLDEERKAIDESKKQMQKEFEKQLSVELERVKASTIAEQEKERDKLTEATHQRLEKEFQDKLEAEKKKIEDRIKGQKDDQEKSYQERLKKLESESQLELNRRLEEIRVKEQKEFETKYDEMRKKLKLEFQAKMANQLAAEKEKIEERVESELRERSLRLEGERKRVVEEEQRKLDGTRLAMKSEIQRELDRRIEEARESLQANYEEKLKLLGVKLPSSREDKMRIYMTRLKEAWTHPPVTADSARELMQLRDVLGLTFEDHFLCEAEIRVQVYVAEVEKEIKKGRIKASDEGALDELKRRYQISAEESSKLEPHILAAFQRALMKAVVLVVDDEESFLDTVKPVLESYGYKVLTKQSPSDALKLLNSADVDMIISDVMFSGTEGDGFSFYEKVQKIPHLKKVPFIMMSGLHEGFFVRTGIQLGVDDYLTKPVDPDMLIAVVEGKLKKYRSLRESD